PDSCAWLRGLVCCSLVFFFSSRRRHTRLVSDWSSDVCSSDLSAAAADPPESAAAAEVSWQDVRVALDEELARLPERFRAPLVLCYLEGKTRDEAARELGWSVGTLRGRLGRGRDWLGSRLPRRGRRRRA